MELLITSQEHSAQSCFLVIANEVSSAYKLLFIFSINSSGLIFINIFVGCLSHSTSPQVHHLKSKSMLWTLSMLSSTLVFPLRALRILYYICPLWKPPELEYAWSLGTLSLVSTESSLLTIMGQTSRKSVIQFDAIHNLLPVLFYKLFRDILPVFSRYLNAY